MQTVKDENMKLQIITNGSLISNNINFISKYVDNIVVSIDSGIPYIHNHIRGKDLFNKTLNGIKLLQQYNTAPSIEIDTTVLNENIDTLSSVITLSNSLGKLFVDFDPVQINGVGNNEHYLINMSLIGLNEAITKARLLGVEITSPERIELIKQYLKGEDIHEPCYSYCKDMLINPEGEIHTCWTINKIIGNVLDVDFKEKWFNSLKNNKNVLIGEKKECYKCGFSHSRMPDKGFTDIVSQANKKRFEQIK